MYDSIYDCPECGATLEWTDLDDTLGLMVCPNTDECDYQCTAY